MSVSIVTAIVFVLLTGAALGKERKGPDPETMEGTYLAYYCTSRERGDGAICYQLLRKYYGSKAEQRRRIRGKQNE